MSPLKLVMSVGKLFFDSLSNVELLYHPMHSNSPLVVTSTRSFQCLFDLGRPGDRQVFSEIKRGRILPFRWIEAVLHNPECPFKVMCISTL